MSSSKKLKCWKVPYVLRCFIPNKNGSYEAYAHHLLISLHPFRTESDVKFENNCTNKLEAPDVIYILNRNGAIKEPYCEVGDKVMLRYNTKVINNDQALNKISCYVLDDSCTKNKSAEK